MNRKEAKRISENAKPEEIREMFLNAQFCITDWKQQSIINKGFTKGLVFNILTAGDLSKQMHVMVRINSIMEFGEFFPGYENPMEKLNAVQELSHQEPLFIK